MTNHKACWYVTPSSNMLPTNCKAAEFVDLQHRRRAVRPHRRMSRRVRRRVGARGRRPAARVYFQLSVPARRIGQGHFSVRGLTTFFLLSVSEDRGHKVQITCFDVKQEYKFLHRQQNCFFPFSVILFTE